MLNFLTKPYNWEDIPIVVAGSLLGTVAEVALLHYRGAFHDPFMFVPLLVPPFASLFGLWTAVAAAPG